MMELKGINIENMKSPNINDDSFVLVLHSFHPASAEKRIIIDTLSVDKKIVLNKLLI